MIHPRGKKFYRPTWVEIDVSAIAYNFRQVRRLIKGKAKTLVALKADAYGHGAVKVARQLIRCGVDYFGVATLREAIELRENKITKPILLLTSVSSKDFENLNPSQLLSGMEFLFEFDIKTLGFEKINIRIKEILLT